MLCRYLWLFSLQLGVAFSVREILLDFRTTSSNGGAFLPTDVVILDKDGDGVKPVVENLSNNILLRIDTMPGFADPNAPNLKEDNYIFLPYISNPTGNSMVRLEFTFSHVASCPTYSHASPVQCKNSITMALVSTTPTEVVAGQNKNNYMVHYLLWRVLTKRTRQNIELNFMIAGRTKFAPDQHFGNIKRRFARTVVSSLPELAQVVNSSAVNNTALIVGDGTRDTEEVIMYDWAQFLPQFFRRLPHILTYHQIVLTAEGVAHCKKLVGESATTEILLNKYPAADLLPTAIPSKGLDLQRQWYLYEQIREFCKPDTQDLVCPRPSFPKPKANAAGTSNTDFTTVQSTAPARKQAKRRRGQKDSFDTQLFLSHDVMILQYCRHGISTRNIDVPGSALFTKVLTDGTDKVENLHINFPSSTTGYRLVIHDEGSSYLFKHLTISSYHCEYIPGLYTLPITCPNTPASNNASPIVQCSCANNSSPTDGKSFIAEKCVYNTAAETADFTRAASSAGVSCSCDPGFTLTGTAPRSCAVTTTTASPLTSGSSGSSSGGGGSTPVPSTKKTSSANTPTVTTECSHASHVACSWALLMLAMTVVLQW
ncbi:hypothetical protein EB796_000787 [Bugula neritina]|uniref:DUF7869 domain-containing protein n=1 Tax=Bugula neritina TaxID=10212 RepID=A0A7J7KRW5_BUGNE|nr:hypothetical protein EB796_000787 [Bugula neritina]